MPTMYGECAGGGIIIQEGVNGVTGIKRDKGKRNTLQSATSTEADGGDSGIDGG